MEPGEGGKSWIELHLTNIFHNQEHWQIFFGQIHKMRLAAEHQSEEHRRSSGPISLPSSASRTASIILSDRTRSRKRDGSLRMAANAGQSSPVLIFLEIFLTDL